MLVNPDNIIAVFRHHLLHGDVKPLAVRALVIGKFYDFNRRLKIAANVIGGGNGDVGPRFGRRSNGRRRRLIINISRTGRRLIIIQPIGQKNKKTDGQNHQNGDDDAYHENRGRVKRKSILFVIHIIKLT